MINAVSTSLKNIQSGL